MCRYWEKRCRQRAFRTLHLGSQKRVLDLVQFKYDPSWRHIPSSVEQIRDIPLYDDESPWPWLHLSEIRWRPGLGITTVGPFAGRRTIRSIHFAPPRSVPPSVSRGITQLIAGIPLYDDKSPRPWLHLLDPRWLSEHGDVILQGPFAGRRTIQSIHFALPRSVPPSFSQGITALVLYQVNFCSFKDTASLVSELPDLESLQLWGVTWELLPCQLPRRRPRLNRNKLRRISVRRCKVEGVESPSFLFPAFSLFPNVHSASSFFSPDTVTTADAILHLVSSGACETSIAYNPDDRDDDIMEYLCKPFVVEITHITVKRMTMYQSSRFSKSTGANV